MSNSQNDTQGNIDADDIDSSVVSLGHKSKVNTTIIRHTTPPELKKIREKLHGTRILMIDIKDWVQYCRSRGEHPDLSKCNLTGVVMPKIDLSNALLVKAILCEAYLYKAKLKKANLSEANLEKANLEEANLQRANLQMADLNGAILDGAKLHKAKITDQQLLSVRSLNGATLPDGTDCDGEYLQLSVS